LPRWRPCFTEDGTWDTAFGKALGQAAIAALAQSLRGRAGAARPRALHLVINMVIAIDGERAQARSNWMVIESSAAGPKIGSGGAYFDDIAKVAGRWRFRYRKIDRFIAARLPEATDQAASRPYLSGETRLVSGNGWRHGGPRLACRNDRGVR
jgi:hypothetical protein